MDKVIKKKKWTIGRIVLYTSLLAAIAFMATWYMKNSGVKKYRVEKDRVTVATVSQDTFKEFIPVTGNVLPIKTVFLDAVEGGQVKEIYVEDGEMVRKGQKLIKLSNASLQLSYMNLETQLLEQINDLQNTQIVMEQNGLNLEEQMVNVEYQVTDLQRRINRNKPLLEENLVSKEEFDQMKDELSYNIKKRSVIQRKISQDQQLSQQQKGQIGSSLDLMKRNLGIIDLSLDNLIVKSPISGQLSSLKIELGESVNRGENLGQIDVLDNYKVRARVDEHYVARIYTGQQGEFNFAGTTYPLTIQKIFPEISNGTFEVDLFFPSKAPEGIKRGQSLQIKLSLSDESQALLIPRGGFYQETGGAWIYVLDPNTNTARKQTISIGRQNPKHYEVTEGLKAGDKVITSSYDTFGEVDELILSE